MSTISWLLERFEKHADRHFMVWSDRPFTYGWLLEHVQGWRERLAELPRNSVTAIEGDSHTADGRTNGVPERRIAGAVRLGLRRPLP